MPYTKQQILDGVNKLHEANAPMADINAFASLAAKDMVPEKQPSFLEKTGKFFTEGTALKAGAKVVSSVAGGAANFVAGNPAVKGFGDTLGTIAAVLTGQDKSINESHIKEAQARLDQLIYRLRCGDKLNANPYLYSALKIKLIEILLK